MASPHEDPGDLHGFCGGRDTMLDTCTCTDLALQLTMRAATLATISKKWKCLCCDLEVSLGPVLAL